MFLHLTVVVLTARDAGRLLAILGQKRKQTLTYFGRHQPVDGTSVVLFHNLVSTELYTRCCTQLVSIGCEPILLALLQHQLTFFVLPRSSFEFGPFFPLVCSVCVRHFISCTQCFKNYALFVNSCIPLCLAKLPSVLAFLFIPANGSILF